MVRDRDAMCRQLHRLHVLLVAAAAAGLGACGAVDYKQSISNLAIRPNPLIQPADTVFVSGVLTFGSTADRASQCPGGPSRTRIVCGEQNKGSTKLSQAYTLAGSSSPVGAGTAARFNITVTPRSNAIGHHPIICQSVPINDDTHGADCNSARGTQVYAPSDAKVLNLLIVKPSPSMRCGAGEYIRNGQCHSCVRLGSPFNTMYGGTRCYAPNAKASGFACGSINLSTLVRNSDSKRNQEVKPCIDLKNPRILLLLPRSGIARAPWLSSGAYIKSSFRLQGNLAPKQTSSGNVIFGNAVYNPGGPRMLIIFEDRYGVVRKQRGGSVKLTGALNVPRVPLNWCFESTIDVCAS